MRLAANASSEDRQVIRRVSSSLVEIALVESQPGYISHRSRCPDGQFWLLVSGEQLVERSRGNGRQRPFDLLYYAPREPAIRKTDTPTTSYGVRLMLSKMQEHERDESWLQGRETTWETQRMAMSLVMATFDGNVDGHALDEAVAQWVAKPQRIIPENARAKWLDEARELLHGDPSLSLLDLSRMLGLAPAYVSAQFSRLQGVTISAYRRQIMLRRTLQHAQNTNLNVAAIEAGFYDASHFHRACVAELDVKPSSLRRFICPT